MININFLLNSERKFHEPDNKYGSAHKLFLQKC
jgi:hypothetical protein